MGESEGGGGMLVENTLWGIEDKLKIALDMLHTFEPPEGYYVAYSGGKEYRREIRVNPTD